MKHYVLRQTNFFYDGSYSYDIKYSHWRIHSKYENLEKSLNQHQKLEITAMRQQEPFLFCDLYANDNYKEILDILAEYLETTFNFEKRSDPRREVFFIPAEASDYQVLKIKEILNVKFYKIIEFDGDIIFYKPLINETFWGSEFMNLNLKDIFDRDYKGYLFYNSSEDATMNIPKILNYYLDTYSKKIKIDGLYGKLEDLSQKPEELYEFLENSKKFKYSLDKIEVIADGLSEELHTLVNLLKNKPYTLIPITYEDAEKLGNVPHPHGYGYLYSSAENTYYI